MKLKKGQRVKLTKKAEKDLAEYAFEANTIGGVLERKHAETTFFAEMLIVKGFPYKATVVNVDGFRMWGEDANVLVRFSFKKGIAISMWFASDSLTKVSV